MELVLSLQMLSAAGAEFTEACSSNSNTCSSSSAGGCTIRPGLEGPGSL